MTNTAELILLDLYCNPFNLRLKPTKQRPTGLFACMAASAEFNISALVDLSFFVKELFTLSEQLTALGQTIMSLYGPKDRSNPTLGLQKGVRWSLHTSGLYIQLK